MIRTNIPGSTILVTGGAGFIGSHLVDRLVKEGANQVVVVDNMFLGNEENLRFALQNGVVLYSDDAEIRSSLEYIFDKHAIDIVFNCATKALNYSFINPSNAFVTNVNVMQNLLELQRLGKFSTLCHFSSSEVYGTAIYEPMDELHPLNPTTTYAGGKAAADIMLQTYVRMFNLDAFIVRPFNNYGPRQNYRGPMAAVIPKTVFRILSGEEPEIHGTGLQSRDFIYVKDTVDAVIKAFPKMPGGDSVNISTDGQLTIRDLIHMIIDILGYKGQPIYKGARKADVECHVASNEKIKSLIDFELTEFRSGLEVTIEWYHDLYRRMLNN